MSIVQIVIQIVDRLSLNPFLNMHVYFESFQTKVLKPIRLNGSTDWTMNQHYFQFNYLNDLIIVSFGIERFKVVWIITRRSRQLDFRFGFQNIVSNYNNHISSMPCSILHDKGWSIIIFFYIWRLRSRSTSKIRRYISKRLEWAIC